jgi:hypothetical protein
VQENKDSFMEKMHRHMFAGSDEVPVVFSKDEQNIVIRFRGAFTKWISEPHLRDIQVINFLVNEYGISEGQAYRDLPRIKVLVGNVRNASKDFQRYRASEMILKGYQVAADATSNTEVKQAMAMIRAGEALVKVHSLDKNEMDYIQFEDIVPLELEPSTDISVIGRKPVANLEALKAKLRQKYGVQQIEDIEFTDIEHGGEETGLL